MNDLLIITGASRGIGKACALKAARRGLTILVNYRVDAKSAEETAKEVRASGALAEIVQGDVAEPDDVERMFAAASDLGELKGLVNNAGIVGETARVDAMDAQRLQRMMQVNVVGTMLCSQYAIRKMSTRCGGTGGVIVNLSSAAARLGSPGQYVDYAASKGAIDTFTIGLSKEVAAEGIRVNAVRPGLIDTEIHASGGEPDRIERLRTAVPMRREGTAEEVADSVNWLLSKDASYVTGALIDVAGGR